MEQRKELGNRTAPFLSCWIRPVTETFSSTAKLISVALPSIAAELVSLPSDAPWSKELIAELTSFPGGKHDDQVDPLIDAVTNFLVGSTYTLDNLGNLGRTLGASWEAQQRALSMGILR